MNMSPPSTSPTELVAAGRRLPDLPAQLRRRRTATASATCAGITSRVAYLAALGVDAVWLSPFYPSALADGGYDVDDYRDVDPRLGTLADFDELVGRAARRRHQGDRRHRPEPHLRPARVVPRGAGRRRPARAARDRYIFRDGRGPDGAQPPSDWQSVFGGPAWDAGSRDGQWYLHLFAPEQPDLNWDNREVRDDFLTTLRFWSDRGVDGFRVDVAHAPGQGPRPSRCAATRRPGPSGRPSPHGTHPFWDRDEVHEIYAEWRQVFNEYDPPRTAVAEAWVHRRPAAAVRQPGGARPGLQLRPARRPTGTPAEFRAVITDNLAEAAAAGASSTWVLSNHDVVRHATRYGAAQDGRSSTGTASAGCWRRRRPPSRIAELGLRRARAATLLMLALPGSAYLYQGEELGLHEVADLARRPSRGSRSSGDAAAPEKGRDGCRVPLPWTARRAVVRLRRRRCAPAAAGLVRPLRGAGAGTRRRLHPGSLPAGAEAAPQAADRRRTGVDDPARTGTSCTSAVPAAGRA